MRNNIHLISMHLERKTIFQMCDCRKTFFIKEHFFMDTVTYMEDIAHLKCLKQWSLFLFMYTYDKLNLCS